ncbi:phosphatase PAP2 family protein [Roseivirga sp. BDSF3-8]|uniref:phosphatase PAP2 family protein n=1 Tax=Roseivirga sp. BDSF3-8 TaxID=3241598 RepID=UPI003531A7DE
MKRILTVFLLAFSFFSIPLYAQVEKSDTIDIADTLRNEQNLKFHERFLYDMKRIGGGVIYVYSRPFKWQGNDWARFGGTVGTAALMAATIDEPVHEFFQDNQTQTLDETETFLFPFGKPGPTYLFTAGLYSIGLVANNEWIRDTGVIITVTLTTAGLVQTAAKTAIGRARPSTGVGAWEYKPFDNRPGYHSLPSGHIIMILSSAYVLGRRIDYLPAKIAMYGLAGAVGLSRMYSSAHFPSDLFLGSILTIACAEASIRYVEKGKEKQFSLRDDEPVRHEPPAIRWSLGPSFGGLSLTGRF